MTTTDLVLLSNGPGELTTWVRPVAAQVQTCHPEWRVSVILAPCSNASGDEADLALSLPGVHRVQGSEAYYRLLLTGRTAHGWDWYDQGAVLFLGGDQGLSVLVARRLGYPLVTYAEWQVRYSRWMGRVGLRNAQVHPQHSQDPVKFRLVGDLNVDGISADPRRMQRLRTELNLQNATLVGLLPGSKALKLTLGVPIVLSSAEVLAQQYPGLKFILPLAPTVSPEKLAFYASSANPNIALMGGATAELVDRQGIWYLVTARGLEIQLWTQFPAYDVLSLCRVCITTVGANTAELGALGVPMVVMVALNKVEVMKAWDGVPGLLMGLPGVGDVIARWINPWLIRRMGLLAWPNLLAGAEIVPELKKVLTPTDVATAALPFLLDDALYERTQTLLKAAMGRPGAAGALINLVEEVLDQK